MISSIGKKWLLVPAALLALVTVAAACGGDDDGGGAGTDESYVKGVCQAFEKFNDDMDEAFTDLEEKFAEIEDDDDFEKVMEDAFKALAGPLKDFANDLGKVKPPADVKEYHDELVVAAKAAAEAYEKGDVELEEDPFEDIPEPPQDVQDRLQAVAENEPACQGLDVFTDDGS